MASGDTPRIKPSVVPVPAVRKSLLRNKSCGPVDRRLSSSPVSQPNMYSESNQPNGKMMEFTDSPVRGRLLYKSRSVLSFTISCESPNKSSHGSPSSKLRYPRPASCIFSADKMCKNRVGPVKSLSVPPPLISSKSVGASSKFCDVSLCSKAVQCELLVGTSSEKSDSEQGSLRGDLSSDGKSDEYNGNYASNGHVNGDVMDEKKKKNHRTKNYLHGNYTTLSYAEIDRLFPQRKISVLVGTWNMNGKAPPSVLEDMVVPTRLSALPDVVVVCTQESHSAKFSWEVSLQQTLGPDHVMLSSSTFGTLHLSVFMRKELIWVCSLPEDGSYSVRPGTKFRTKGGVAVGLSIFGTSFLFICSHLTAHTERLTDRVADIKRISTGIDLPKILPLKSRHKDVTLNYDCVFWAGDLNFRLASQRLDVIENVSNGWKCVEPSKGALMAQRLLADDQLKQILRNGEALKGFDEGVITFPPTYKYVPGTSDFEKAKERTPAYTDRILFRARPGTDLECLEYDSVPSITSSDHKPVWGSYLVTLKPGSSKVPLAAGLFNRAVYIQGTKRWAEVGWSRKDTMQNSAPNCRIQ